MGQSGTYGTRYVHSAVYIAVIFTPYWYVVPAYRDRNCIAKTQSVLRAGEREAGARHSYKAYPKHSGYNTTSKHLAS